MPFRPCQVWVVVRSLLQPAQLRALQYNKPINSEPAFNFTDYTEPWFNLSRSMKTTPASKKAPRADAQVNRRRILDAAHAHFAAHGLAADMDAIAHEAGVGVGTLYNHFGNKEGLLEAVVLNGLQDLEAYIQTLLAEPDPWTAVEKLVRHMAERSLQDRAFGALIASQPTLHTTSRATKRGLGPLIQQILDRAKAAGQLQANINPGDIPLLLAGLAQSDASPATLDRYLTVILNGLRAQP